MSSIVFQTDKKTGTKYAYESVSYWDKEKKQPRSKRKYIGRVDPETGEIKPKGNRTSNTPQKQCDPSVLPDLREELCSKEKEIADLKRELSALSQKYERAVHTLSKIERLAKEKLEE